MLCRGVYLEETKMRKRGGNIFVTFLSEVEKVRLIFFGFLKMTVRIENKV